MTKDGMNEDSPDYLFDTGQSAHQKRRQGQRPQFMGITKGIKKLKLNDL